MVSFPLERLRHDWELIVKAGIPNIWLADSNFGALKDDLEKARIVCELKERYGLPRSFATSWSKKHSPRVQEIVLMLNAHGLLPFYQLALQTLTPRALELCHRENMAANEYEPIARRMAEAGVPKLSIVSFAGLFGPAKMPKDVVDKIARSTATVLARRDVLDGLDRLAFEGRSSTPEELGAFLKEQVEIWRRTVKEVGIAPD